MKTIRAPLTTIIRLYAAASLCGIMILPAAAQSRPVPPPRRYCDSNPVHDAGNNPFTRRWLKRMKRHHPEEYRHLKELREQDPEAFRDELAQRLQQKRIRKTLRHYPALSDAYKTLSQQEKQALAHELFKPPRGPAPSGRMGRKKNDPPNREPSPKIIEQLIRQYRSAVNPEKKAAIRQQIVDELERTFDESTHRRMQSIEQLQDELDLLREKLALREANRDKIIEKRLQELTRDDTVKR